MEQVFAFASSAHLKGHVDVEVFVTDLSYSSKSDGVVQLSDIGMVKNYLKTPRMSQESHLPKIHNL